MKSRHLTLAFSILALVSGFVTLPAFGDQIVTFDASGTFADGASLGGTYTVDTTTGTAIAVDLTFGAPVSSAVTFLDGNSLFGGKYLQYTLNNEVGPNFYPGFSFTINAASLAGYTGGAIQGALYLETGNPSDVTALTSGSLTAVPLPAAAWLLLSGLVGVGAIARTRRAA